MANTALAESPFSDSLEQTAGQLATPDIGGTAPAVKNLPDGETTSGLDPSDVGRLTDNERFIAALHQFTEANSEYSTALNSLLERLHTTLESLRPPKPADKKTAFWTAYKTLADEFDKEFQRKYGNDLDTMLIFAGLFSAVSSAFIIEIQPEFQPNPNSMTETLLLALVQNITGGTPPGIEMPGPTGPGALVVVAQSLLYFSLLSTLLAALLAVLGKQWLLHYDSVGEKGTLEERGLERQRKLDGLRDWKFDLVMQIFPLLLQFGLLLFTTALTIYLWTVHHVIASMVLGITFLGFIVFTVMVISAVASPDSPFQTSLTLLLAKAILYFPTFQRLRSRAHTLLALLWSLLSPISLGYSHLVDSIIPFLPQFNIIKSPTTSPSHPQPIFNGIPEPSKVVSAVLWALETTTNPQLIEAAAVIIPDLQWPTNFDLRPSLKRLSDIINLCFDAWSVQKGTSNRAINCLKAFGILEMFSNQQKNTLGPDPSTLLKFPTGNYDEELKYVLSLSCLAWGWPGPWPRMDVKYTPATVQWMLRFISGHHLPEMHIGRVVESFQPDQALLCNHSVFSDFLFCINSFFSPPSISDISLLDKSKYSGRLTTLLFQNLAARLADPRPLDLKLVADIVKTVSQFSVNLNLIRDKDTQHRNAVYHFCASPGLQRNTITLALQTVRLNDYMLYSLSFDSYPDSTGNLSWVYDALEELCPSPAQSPVTDTVCDFLQVLFCRRPICGKPTLAGLCTILWALSLDDRVPQILASHVLCSAPHWFQDDELWPVLKQQSVWARLGRIDLTVSNYISLGDEISKTPQWNGMISQDLPTWLAKLPAVLSIRYEYDDETKIAFGSVLSRVWNIDEAEGSYFGDEKTLVMAFTVLENVWNQLDFLNLQQIHQVASLLDCTLLTVFSAWVRQCGSRVPMRAHPSQPFQDIVIVRLQGALQRAAENAQMASTSDAVGVDPDLKNIMNSTAALLSKLALTTQKGRESGHITEIDYWMDLQDEFQVQVQVLRQLFDRTSLPTAMVLITAEDGID